MKHEECYLGGDCRPPIVFCNTTEILVRHLHGFFRETVFSSGAISVSAR